MILNRRRVVVEHIATKDHAVRIIDRAQLFEIVDRREQLLIRMFASRP